MKVRFRSCLVTQGDRHDKSLRKVQIHVMKSEREDSQRFGLSGSRYPSIRVIAGRCAPSANDDGQNQTAICERHSRPHHQDTSQTCKSGDGLTDQAEVLARMQESNRSANLLVRRQLVKGHCVDDRAGRSVQRYGVAQGRLCACTAINEDGHFTLNPARQRYRQFLPIRRVTIGGISKFFQRQHARWGD